MSVNSSDSHLHPQLSSVDSFVPLVLYCFVPKPGCFIFHTFTMANILVLLPLCILILRHGFQQWRKQSFSQTTATHSGTFTYHLLTMELIHIFGCILCCFGIYMGLFHMLIVWCYLFSISVYGEGVFHILTCLEHYLAVVRPITYLSLKKTRWIQIRNITIGCIWLLCCGLTCLSLTGNMYLMLIFCLAIACVIMISFCSLSVLYVLIHPGPGEQGGGRDRARIHQSKQRAFYTIVAVLGVLMLRCIYILVWTVQSELNGSMSDCVLTLVAVWIYFPGSLVSPLLYLHKMGMLGCRSHRK